jgi:redox-sensitive bicupin YhaK (pirin superfamily)
MSIRPVKRIVQSKPTVEGAGVNLRRAFGFGNTSDFDPFLLLDDFRNDNPDDYLAGFPWHPHRGIETITYVLAGSVEHGDSLGNHGSLGAGDVQWMTAGSGILHQEMPKGDPAGRMHGFQLWANLPSSLKMTAPRYQDVAAGDIPEVVDDDGTRVRVICGDFWGRRGPVDGVAADPRYVDVFVPAGADRFRWRRLDSRSRDRKSISRSFRHGRGSHGAGRRRGNSIPARLRAADRGAGGLVRADCHEHQGTASAGLR